MSEQKGLVHLTLTDVAERICKHLRRLEVEEYRRRVAAGTHRELGAAFYNAGASRHGAYVHVTYITYQGGTNLTRTEALHYLAALDAGFTGRHHELFQKNPPPVDPETEVRFVALVRSGEDFCLFGVTKRTATRVYGEKIAGTGYWPSFVERSRVLKLQATQADLDRVLDAQREMRAEIAVATRKFRDVLDSLSTLSDQEPP